MQLRHYVLGAAPLLLALAAACSDSSTGPSVNTTRVYDQVDRLGNPLVAEVFLAKRNHAFHNGGKPSTDVANHSAELQAFITGSSSTSRRRVPAGSPGRWPTATAAAS